MMMMMMSLISLWEVEVGVKDLYGKCTAVVLVIMWGKVKNDDGSRGGGGGGGEKRMIFRVDKCGSDEYSWIKLMPAILRAEINFNFKRVWWSLFRKKTSESIKPFFKKKKQQKYKHTELFCYSKIDHFLAVSILFPAIEKLLKQLKKIQPKTIDLTSRK